MVDRRDVGAAQVRAHRFARHRTDEAMTTGNASSGGAVGGLGRRCTVLSYGVASVILVGTSALALVRPAPDWRSAAVLVDTGSGAVFVNREGVLFPALNLTSALLAAPGPAPSLPMEVSVADIASASRGATLGIPGAPDQLPTAGRLITDGWSICDETTADGALVSTEVIGAAAAGSPLATAAALLVVPSSGLANPDPVKSTVAQLVWAGHRTPVDLRDVASIQALGLAGVTPRPISDVLLAAIPISPPISVMAPSGSGQPPRGFTVRDHNGLPVPVGAVLRVLRADGTVTLHLVHQDGVELISPLVADLLRYRTDAQLVTVEPRQLAVLPAVDARIATTVPAVAPQLLSSSAVPMICAAWRGEERGWDVVVGTVLPDGTTTATPAIAGAQVDRVQIAGGAGALVRRLERTSADNGSTPMVLVTDLGVVHPVTREAAVRLGLTSDNGVVPAVPAALIDAMVAGPMLDVEAAGRIWHYRPGADVDASGGESAGAGPPG
ncbi:MAG: type VII secretion protein EccB [Nakamurella sp.]